jgi:hypothetical protein
MNSKNKVSRKAVSTFFSVIGIFSVFLTVIIVVLMIRVFGVGFLDSSYDSLRIAHLMSTLFIFFIIFGLIAITGIIAGAVLRKK